MADKENEDHVMFYSVTEREYQRRVEPRKEAFGTLYEIRRGLLRRGIH
jgi:hypothetical protein